MVENISVEYSEIDKTARSKKMIHKRIVDLDSDEMDAFYESFFRSIYGHDKFKNDFIKLINNFKVFNMLGEHKILSLFTQ